jgi:hypothetical protein
LQGRKSLPNQLTTLESVSTDMRYIDDPDYWWYRAQELRAKALGVREFDIHCALIAAADACERRSRLLEAQLAPLPD